MPARPQPVQSKGHRGPYRLHPPLDLPANTVVGAVTRRRVGKANPRGRLERLLGPFRLRDDLAAPGDMAFADAVAMVLKDWERQVENGNVTSAIVGTYKRNLADLTGHLNRIRVVRVCDITPNDALRWCLMSNAKGNAPSWNTSNTRRASLRGFFDTAKLLGITDANPAKSIEFPSRSDRYVNALTDEQIRHVQDYAMGSLDDTRTPAAFALIMSGTSNLEAALITIADVDLDNGRVWVSGGGYRHRDRWLPLYDQWCRDAVARRVRDLNENVDDGTGSTYLVYTEHRSQPTANRQAAAITSMLHRLLERTRVHQPGVNRIESIREWLALKVFTETGRLEDVALRFGTSSLDAAAHIVGHDWLHSPESVLLHTPPPHRQEPPDANVEHPPAES